MSGRRPSAIGRPFGRTGIRIGLLFGILATAGTALADSTPGAEPETEPYRAIVERPLFRPGRRPEPPAPVLRAAVDPAAAEPEAGDLPPADPGLAFLGTVLHDGRIVALVALPDRSEPLRLTVGSEIAGWRVTDIEPTRLVIETEDAYEEYTILE